jgi:hypothetical protein
MMGTNVFSYTAKILAVIVAFFMPPTQARSGELWTVQALDAGGEVVCDAFAAGMMGRPFYEFRFRRS